MNIDESQIYDIHADLCKAIANRTRLMMVALLADREMSVGEMVERLGISVTNASQHLRILRNNHIVHTRREGQTVFYRLTDARLPKACALIRSILLDDMRKRNEIARKVGKVKK